MSQPTEPTTEAKPETAGSEPQTEASTSEPTWMRRYREGVAQLESLWKEAQKYQDEGLRRARAAADDLGKTLAATYADTSERLVKLAAEAKSRSAELYGRAHDLLERKGGSAEAKDDSEPAEAKAEPQVVVEAPAEGPKPSEVDPKNAPN